MDTKSKKPLAGIGLMVLACLLFPLGDTIAKHLVGVYDVRLIVWLKFLVQTVVIVLVILFTLPLRTFGTHRPGVQIGRGLAGVGSYGLFLAAVSYIPLADAIAIEFSSPLLVVALSIPLLGESVGVRRWSAVIVGFAGTLLIVRPGLGMVHWAATLMLAAALCVALMQIASRVLAHTEHAMTSMFYLSATGLAVSSLWMPFVPSLELAPGAWAMIVVVGALAAFCHFLFVRAYEFATASLLAPFTYGQILGATALGYLVFGDIPDAWTTAGTAVLIASGIYIVYRETQLAREHNV